MENPITTMDSNENHNKFNNINISNYINLHNVIAMPIIAMPIIALPIIDYKYICIKKEFFNVNMITLNTNNIKQNKQLDIIYKTPSLFLDGIFLKTPPIHISNIHIINKYNKNSNIHTIKLYLLEDQQNKQQDKFITLLKSIDDTLYKLLLNYSKDNNSNIFLFNYNNIIHKINNKWEFNMKSYLDNKTIDNLYSKTHLDEYFIFTFNITHMYINSINILPLVKCNKCEM